MLFNSKGPSRGKGKKLVVQGLSLEGHLDGCFSDGIHVNPTIAYVICISSQMATLVFPQLSERITFCLSALNLQFSK